MSIDELIKTFEDDNIPYTIEKKLHPVYKINGDKVEIEEKMCEVITSGTTGYIAIKPIKS